MHICILAKKNTIQNFNTIDAVFEIVKYPDVYLLILKDVLILNFFLKKSLKKILILFI